MKKIYILILFCILLFSGCSKSGESIVEGNISTQIIEPRDGLTDAILFIDYEHHEVHGGSSYILSNQETLNINGEYDYVLNTSGMNGKQAHLLVLARATSEANFFIYEGVTFSGGTPNGEVNRNRNSNKTSTMTILEDATILTRQTKILEEHFGIGKNLGGESRNILEFVLEENQTYSIEFTSEAASNDISWLIQWYEHTPSGGIN